MSSKRRRTDPVGPRFDEPEETSVDQIGAGVDRFSDEPDEWYRYDEPRDHRKRNSASFDETAARWLETIKRLLTALIAWIEVEAARAAVNAGPLWRRYVRWQRRVLQRAGVLLAQAGHGILRFSRSTGRAIATGVGIGRERVERARAYPEMSDEPGPRSRKRPKAGRARAADDADTVPESIGLQNLALDAWRARQVSQSATREVQIERQTARDAAALRQLLSQRLGISVTPSSGRVEVEGVVFGASWNSGLRRYELVVLGTCPGCGAVIGSGDILDLADLGEVLDDIAAGRNRCEECQARDATMPVMNARLNDQPTSAMGPQRSDRPLSAADGRSERSNDHRRAPVDAVVDSGTAHPGGSAASSDQTQPHTS